MSAPIGHGNNRIDAALLGKIVFARFLGLPLKVFDRVITEVESSPEFAALRPWLRVGRLDGDWVVPGAADASQVMPSPILGDVQRAGRRLVFRYHRDRFGCEYRFDEEGLRRQLSRPGFSGEFAATLHRLRLINSRNRLTHALMRGLLDIQAAYLFSGEPLSLVPLPQSRMSRHLADRASLPLVADAGRLSRLIRGLSFRMVDGATLPLSALFPSARQLNCHRIDFLVKAEKTLILEGRLARPLSDGALATLLAGQGVSLSRRTVAAIRHQLAIPDWRRRGDRKDYLAATEGFSPLLPMTAQALSAFMPAHPGVYEIRSAASVQDGDPGDGKSMSPERARIVYIGSTRDLRKRLGDHLRGNSDNPLLYRCITEGSARVRFRQVSDGWRWVERELYRVFCETFGAPPLCNRMSP